MKHMFTPDTITRPPKPRCCAKCSTPGYGCARKGDCQCHVKREETARVR